MSELIDTQATTQPKPWEMEWVLKGVQAANSPVEAMQEIVTGKKKPWEMNWTEKGTSSPTPVQQPDTPGLDINSYLKRVIYAESGGNPKAKNPQSSATGLAQFTSGTWQAEVRRQKLDYSLEDRQDPDKVMKVLTGFTQQNVDKAKRQLGREPTDHELYMYHFMPATASKFIKADGSEDATQLVSPKVVESNISIFKRKDKETGKFVPRTVSEVIDIFKKKMRGKNG